MPTPSRRTVLFAAGGAGLALVGAGGTFAVTRTPTRALTPWQDVARSTGDIRLDAFRYAILAPNPHNRQPWRITLEDDNAAIVHCDLDRRLPHTDPFDRQIVIGFGCFLELTRIAASSRGYKAEIMAFPEGTRDIPARLDQRPIARLVFTRDAAAKADPLFGAILNRRSAKVPFDLARSVSPAVLAAVRGDGTAEASSDAALVDRLRRLTWDAWLVEAKTPRTFRESVDLMRIGRSEIEANPDGIALGGPMIEALALAGQITREALADPNSTAFKAGLDKYRPILATATGYAWIRTGGNTRRDQLDAGRRYVRMNLAANAADVAVHPVSQALQEFPELTDHHAKVRAALGIGATETLQMLARIGYAAEQPPTPRWALETKVRRA